MTDIQETEESAEGFEEAAEETSYETAEEAPEDAPEYAEEAEETPEDAAGDGAEETPEEAAEETAFEDVAKLTKNEAPPSFNREKVLKIVMASVAVLTVSAFVANSASESRKKNAGVSGAPGVSVPDFLRRERDNASRPDGGGDPGGADSLAGLPAVEFVTSGDPARPGRAYPVRYLPDGTPVAYSPDGTPVALPDGTPISYLPDGTPVAYLPDGAPSGPAGGALPAGAYGQQQQSYPPAPQQQRQGGGGGGSGGSARRPEHSPLVPAVEGSLFSSGQQQGYQPQAAYDPYGAAYASPYGGGVADGAAYYQYQQQQPSYQAQNMQDDKKDFYNGPESSVTGRGGYYLGDNVIWTGTIIPGVLVTGINTDLPGDIVARTTANVYDSRTGKNLLLPQGAILVARYNSAVSYAQSRVQIVWEHLIRPDGYMFDLEGMNGVDAKGVSGQAGAYHENWFQYLKAAGIIAMFTLANAKLTEAAAVSLSEEAAQANSQLTAQLGSNIINRALDIQPTVTVESGERINVMINRPVYLPPVADYPATERYSRRQP